MTERRSGGMSEKDIEDAQNRINNLNVRDTMSGVVRESPQQHSRMSDKDVEEARKAVDRLFGGGSKSTLDFAAEQTLPTAAKAETETSESALAKRMVGSARGTIYISTGVPEGVPVLFRDGERINQASELITFGDGVPSGGTSTVPRFKNENGFYAESTGDKRVRWREGFWLSPATDPQTRQPTSRRVFEYAFRDMNTGDGAYPQYLGARGGRGGGYLYCRMELMPQDGQYLEDQLRLAEEKDRSGDGRIHTAALVRQIAQEAALTGGGLSKDAWKGDVVLSDGLKSNPTRPPYDRMPEEHVVYDFRTPETLTRATNEVIGLPFPGGHKQPTV